MFNSGQADRRTGGQADKGNSEIAKWRNYIEAKKMHEEPGNRQSGNLRSTIYDLRMNLRFWIFDFFFAPLASLRLSGGKNI